TLDEVARIKSGGDHAKPSWPMIVMRTPKGWTGPKEVDGKPVEGTWRAHQVPVADFESSSSHLRILEDWMRRYRPEELFASRGALVEALAPLPPRGDRRMSANPHANGGELLKDLRLPDFREYAAPVARPGTTSSEATRVMGKFLRDVVEMNPNNFRIVGPDETASNRLDAVYQATDKAWDADTFPVDEHLSPDGRVME